MDAQRFTPHRGTTAPPPGRPGFAWLWAASLLIPLAGFVGIAWTSWHAAETDARNRVGRVVDLLHEHALRAFETQETILAAIDEHIRELDWPGIRVSSGVYRFIHTLDQQSPSTSGASIVAPDGTLAATSRGAWPVDAIDLNDRDYVAAHRVAADRPASLHIGEVIVSRQSSLMVFTFSRPRIDAAGRRDGGVIVTTFPPQYFSEFYRGVSESVDDAVLLARADGVILARSPPPPELMHQRVPAESRLLQAFAAAPDGRGLVRGAAALDGIDRLTAFRRVGDYRVFVAYGLDIAALHAAWHRQLVAPAAAAVAAAMILLLLTARTRSASRRGQLEAERRADAEAASGAAEAQLRHAERVNALGLLAAGVAHDFGNALQSITAGARLLESHAEEPTKVRRYAALIAEAAARGGSLTSRMRNFARRDLPGRDGETPPFDPGSAIHGACELLERSLRAPHRIRCVLAPALPVLDGIDRTEFEAALVNLVVNARDAMPDGGEVLVTATVAATAPPPLPAGDYLCLAVADTGIGMDAATLARAGEAFFTTKGPGQGTGLGLSMARGFASRAGGVLAIDSALGQGTTVTLWLPVTPPPAPG